VVRAARPEPWSTTCIDPKVGAVRCGRAAAPPDRPAATWWSRSTGSAGASTATTSCARRGPPAPRRARLPAPGAARRDRLGEDFYHAGLTADLEAALRSPALAGYRDLFVVGYSLGGHLTLSHGARAERPAPAGGRQRVRAARPGRPAAAIDHPRAAVYCGHVLAGSRRSTPRSRGGRRCPTPLAERAARRTTIRAWDRLAVVPRFGFVSVDDYHRACSVGPRLAGVQVPALVLSAPADPMIPAATIAPHVRDLPAS
jgi:predicted alpha/beta-fold hydrolase